MIQANELRLNNCYSINGKIYTLGTSDFMDFLNEAQVNNGSINNIDPIPLTPEILEKFGFEKHTDSQGDAFWYVYTYEDFEFTENGAFTFNGSVMPHIQYLHELQNLYFALTGTELEIKL